MNINENYEYDKAVIYDENLKPVLQVFEKEWDNNTFKGIPSYFFRKNYKDAIIL